MNEKVLIDTSIWIMYFRDERNIVETVENLLNKNAAFITGPVISELLQGMKNKKEMELLNKYIDAVPYEPCQLDDWKNTGIISLELRKKGITVPLTDVLIASVAMRCKMKIYTLDKHFLVIPGVTV